MRGLPRRQQSSTTSVVRTILGILIAVLLILFFDSRFTFDFHGRPASWQGCEIRFLSCAAVAIICARRHQFLVISAVSLIFLLIDGAKIRAAVLIDTWPPMLDEYPLSLLGSTWPRLKWTG